MCRTIKDLIIIIIIIIIIVCVALCWYRYDTNELDVLYVCIFAKEAAWLASIVLNSDHHLPSLDDKSIVKNVFRAVWG
jgi:hypothetical protein